MTDSLTAYIDQLERSVGQGYRLSLETANIVLRRLARRRITLELGSGWAEVLTLEQSRELIKSARSALGERS